MMWNVYGIRKNHFILHKWFLLMKIVAGTSSSNPAGWGWKTKGFSGSPSGKVPQDFSNEELTEGKGMSDTVIKTGALMTKRYIINKGARR